MAEIAEAHACLDSGQHLGKVVITMTSETHPAGCRRDGVREVKSRPGQHGICNLHETGDIRAAHVVICFASPPYCTQAWWISSMM